MSPFIFPLQIEYWNQLGPQSHRNFQHDTASWGHGTDIMTLTNAKCISRHSMTTKCISRNTLRAIIYRGRYLYVLNKVDRLHLLIPCFYNRLSIILGGSCPVCADTLGCTLRSYSQISLNQTNISLHLLRIIFKYCATLGKNIAWLFDVWKNLKGGNFFQN